MVVKEIKIIESAKNIEALNDALVEVQKDFILHQVIELGVTDIAETCQVALLVSRKD